MAALMPKADAPCKGCTKRTAGCWSTCEEYAEFKKKRDDLRHKIKSVAKDDVQIYRYIAEQQCKCTRKKMHEH